jgi:hypothetical protein
MDRRFAPRAVTMLLTLALSVAIGGRAHGQAAASSGPAAQAPPPGTAAAGKPETHITPQQAKDLFRSVDQILQFVSNDTGLAIKHSVKRKLTTRAAVEKYLDSKMRDDKDAKRMQRSEIVLKKFGLLDRNFQLGPFLVSLLKEQIAGYYDSKTKTVYLLDWIDPESQKPVMAHELTHALQDQRVNLNKWDDQSLEDISRNAADDNRHIQTDEVDTARQAVLEGQAMVTFFDYALAPHHTSIAKAPDFIGSRVDELTDDTSDSPIMAHAPRVLKDSLIFPYREGLKFEIQLIKDRGEDGAFADVLDHPPASSYEIMNPKAYEARVKVPVLTMPDVHSLLDADYAPYDVGVMGELDVRMLLDLTASADVADLLASQWDGGIYYAAQKKNAPDKASTSSVSLLYLSQWKTPGAAGLFAKNYELELAKKYKHAELEPGSELATGERVYSTEEGPVVIAINGRQVFVSESFDLATAHKLELLMFGAQQGAEGQSTAALGPGYPELTGSLVHFGETSGILRVDLPEALATPLH